MTQERARATRQAIIAGAASVFEVQGYGLTSLARVADEAGVTKGALYFHFASKEALAQAVIEEQHAFAVKHSEPILSQGHPALVEMILITRGFGQDLIHEPIVRAGVRLTFEATAFGADVAAPYQDWVNSMERLSATAQTEGYLRPSLDPAVFARLLVAAFTGVQMVSNILTAREDVMRRIEEMWAILLPGVLAEAYLKDSNVLAGRVTEAT